MAGLRRIALGTLGASMALGPTPGPLTTVEQRDPERSPRAQRMADVSADGRYVVFESRARLVNADDDQRPDIYLLDRATGTVSLESGGLPPETETSNPRVSGDGSLIVFEVRWLTAEPRMEIALRDRRAATLRMLTDGNGDVFEWSRSPAISDDGRYVVFSSASTSLVPGPDANGRREDVYRLDLPSGKIERVSLTSSGAHLAQGNSTLPELSGDGRWIVFAATAPLDSSNRTRPPAESPVRHVFLRDLATGITTRVSRARRGEPNADSSLPSISADGRFIAFASQASNLSENDRNQGMDVFLFDRENARLTRVSRSADGSGPSGTSGNPMISANGRYIVFQSDAANLVCAARCSRAYEDLNLLWDVFLFDRTSGRTIRLSEDELGGWPEWSAGPAIDASGAVVAFSSRHPIDADDLRDDLDLFVRHLN